MWIAGSQNCIQSRLTGRAVVRMQFIAMPLIPTYKPSGLDLTDIARQIRHQVGRFVQLTIRIVKKEYLSNTQRSGGGKLLLTAQNGQLRRFDRWIMRTLSTIGANNQGYLPALGYPASQAPAGCEFHIVGMSADR